MPQKYLVRKQSSPGDYEIVQDHVHQKVDAPQKADVENILDTAEKALKQVFDNSGISSLASGVKLGLQEMY
jgi:hypothetical protein